MRRDLRLAAPIALFALPLQAEVAPNALWAHWQSGEGTLTATGDAVPADGDALRITGATVEIGTLSAEIGEMTLTSEGEGTRVTLPEEWTVESGELTAAVDAPGATILATGAAEAPTYRIDAPRLSVPLEGTGQLLSVVAVELSGALASDGFDLSADSLSVAGEATEDLSAFSAARRDLSVQFDGPLDALADLIQGAPTPDLALTVEAASSTQSLTPRDDVAPTFTITSGATRDAITVTEGVATLEQSLAEVQVAAAGEEVPLPDASATAEEVALSLVTSVAISDEPAPVSLELDVTDLTVSEQAWQLFDPAGELPREPADLRLALSGQILRRSPTELSPERLGLDEFALSALGTTLTGSGSVLFQEAGGERPYGRPVGSFSFNLAGAMSLLDQLDALGTISTGNLVGMRMGLGFFTTEGDGPDELQSNVDIGPQGGVSLNGRRVLTLP
ncbi:hypothetical protein SAMN04488020_104136 [Palleronia marisminoris]|uniref:DUF2125 domain-containing protein n=1 Tax=Palleronia marisminoris TaxID=315423 RepID=A0A1Y5SM54_9RHOB|nr:DUF2125 domain-containing protein [Palleronia marisminoris]SFG83357.1 hypothetical protein SAMN04488020_104136 [Palleronia marisminoris]SLN40962.1 hypothetical protein PAM7066_01759 [Palleronia marisminoris]